MDIQQPLTLLGGLTPAQFMRRHWHKKPLLVRQAIPNFQPPVLRPEMFALAAEESVESRLVQQIKGGWKLRHGPFARRSLPAMSQREWTLLVQGVDLHNDAVLLEGNVMTEYEEKFSSIGNPICKMMARFL